MVRVFFLIVVMLCPPLASSQAPEYQFNKVEATVKRMSKNGQSYFQVNATGFVRATQEQTWQVLTDYDRLPEFVPDLDSSKLISRADQEVLVEQHSTAGFLFVSQSIHLVVRVTEQPFSTIDVSLVSGDMKQYAARWGLAPVTDNGIDGTRITYSGVMEPDFFVPPLLGRPLVEANVRKMVEAVVIEIERRSAQK